MEEQFGVKVEFETVMKEVENHGKKMDGMLKDMEQMGVA